MRIPQNVKEIRYNILYDAMYTHTHIYIYTCMYVYACVLVSIQIAIIYFGNFLVEVTLLLEIPQGKLWDSV